MDDKDLRAVLSGKILLVTLLQAKLAALNSQSEPFLGVDDIIRSLSKQRFVEDAAGIASRTDGASLHSGGHHSRYNIPSNSPRYPRIPQQPQEAPYGSARTD